MEVVRQDEAFVELLLGRVLHLLFRTLQSRASLAPTLHRDLGLPATHKVPVSYRAIEQSTHASSPDTQLSVDKAVAQQEGCVSRVISQDC